MAEKTDRRVKYTKMALRQSLISLMNDKAIEKITVKDICSNADINRGTFYAHYSDPYDLLHQIEDELFQEILGSIETSLNTDSIAVLLSKIFETIVENKELCRVLFSDYGDKTFVKRIMFIARDRSIAEWKKMMPAVEDEQLGLLYMFYANGCVAIIQHWFENGTVESPKDLALFMEKISKSGLTAFQ